MLHNILLVLHVLAAGTLIGLVVMTAVLAVRKDFGLAALALLQKARWLGPFGSGLAFITGAGLYTLEPEEFRGRPIFWVKIAIYLLEGTIASLVIDRQVKSIEKQESAGERLKSLRWWYVVHAGMIIAIAILGVTLTLGEPPK